jgi:hypothetical protein
VGKGVLQVFDGKREHGCDGAASVLPKLAAIEVLIIDSVETGRSESVIEKD